MSFSTGKNKILNTPKNPVAQELYRSNTKKGKNKPKKQTKKPTTIGIKPNISWQQFPR